MEKTILVCGFGPGISTSIANRFGKEGFSVGLVARNAERLTAGVRELEANGIRAAGFPTDLADPDAVRALIGRVHQQLGPINVLQWNAFSASAGDLLTADEASVRAVFEIPVTTLVVAVQAALADLRKAAGAALLVTNGGLGLFDPQADAMAVEWGAMGLAVANAAKHKLVRLLAHKLKAEGVYVGEVVVLAPVKGTSWDDGGAKLEAATVADKFWEIYQARSAVSAMVG